MRLKGCLFTNYKRDNKYCALSEARARRGGTWEGKEKEVKENRAGEVAQWAGGKIRLERREQGWGGNSVGWGKDPLERACHAHCSEDSALLF